MRSISIVILNSVPKEVLEAITREFRNNLDMISDIMTPTGLPKEFYNPFRHQFLADKILEFLSKKYKGMVLGITSKDIYTEGLNFIFGQAQLGGNVALISTHRLNPSFYGKEGAENLLVKRAVKEAVHEVCHLLGLHHCGDRNCVMSFSNTIFDVDAKSKNLCERCKPRLEKI
jgi:archaemetzincin